EHAVRLSEKLFNPNSPAKDPLAQKIFKLTADPSPQVRYQVAFTLGEIRGLEKIKALAEIARRDLDSTWVQAAVFSSLAEGAGELFASLSTDRQFLIATAGQD